MMKWFCSGVLAFTTLASPAAADLRLTTYGTAKAPDKVRRCIVQVLHSAKGGRGAAEPTITPFSASPRNDSWTIDFRYRGQTASVVVFAAPSSRSRVVYPTRIAVEDEALAQSIEDCG